MREQGGDIEQMECVDILACQQQFEFGMEEEQQNEFLVELEKLMTSEVATTLWASNMDLMALTTFDNLLELYRISYKAQRVFQIEENKPIKSLAFSPDSQLLAYGLVDGTLKLLKTENGQRVVVVETVSSSEIQSLTFLSYCELQSTAFLPFQKNSMESRLILNICPHKNCNKNAIIKINYFSDMRKDFTLLLSSEKSKTTLLINGFIPLAEVNYQGIDLVNPRVMYSHYDGTIRSVVCEEKPDKYTLWLVEYEAEAVGRLQQHLIKFNCLLAYVTEILSFVEVTYDSAELIVRDILRQYNSKINLIDDPNIENLSPCEELFRFLNCGITSTAIVNFFTKEVFDTRILEKLDETLNGCFAQLHDLILESVQNSLEKATILLSRLQSLSQVPQVALLGLQSYQLAQIGTKISKLYTMGQILLVESTEAKFDIRNLLVWLNKATIKSSGENEAEIENTKSYLNKYTVDFNRLHNFLAEEKKFKLQNLLNFFAKNSDSHPLNIQPAEFRILAQVNPNRNAAAEKETFNKLVRMFDVEDIQPIRNEKMVIEEHYRSYKIEMKELLAEWRNLTRVPLGSVSKMISQKSKKTLMGEVEASELFSFEIKPIMKEGQLLTYFVERVGSIDRLVEYNCHTRSRNYLTSKDSHILSLAVAENILAVLENKLTMHKIVGQVANSSFDGSEIEVGRRISKAEGELDISSSLRGLNSLVIDKNKLIIFD